MTGLLILTAFAFLAAVVHHTNRSFTVNQGLAHDRVLNLHRGPLKSQRNWKTSTKQHLLIHSSRSKLDFAIALIASHF